MNFIRAILIIAALIALPSCEQSDDSLPETSQDELDRDGDGVENSVDAFPDDPAESSDLDGDGIGDNSDPDIDGDGIENTVDAFPRDPAEFSDLDGDGIGDNSDPDIDGDGVENTADAFPRDPAESSDLDSDGIGDNSDPDIDGDGIENTADTFPRDPAESSDLDGDGIGDNGDPDIDGDGFTNDEEVLAGSNPKDPNDIPGDDLRILFSQITPPITDSQYIDLNGAVYGKNIDRVYLTSEQYPGTTFSATVADDSWTSRVTLKVGDNLISAHVLGNDEEMAEASKTFQRSEPVLVKSIVFDTPANNSLVNVGRITVSGRVLSETAIDLPVVNINNSTARVIQGASPTEFIFKATVDLQIGSNIIIANSIVAGNSLQETLNINYQPEEVQLLPPAVGIISPQPGTTLATDSFILSTLISSEAGLASVTINGLTQTVSASGHIEKTLNFAGQSQLDVDIVATDKRNQVSTLNASYYRDTVAPVIQVDSIDPYPAENSITENPYNLTGTVSDPTLLQVTLNNKVLTLEPTATQNSYRFNARLALQAGQVNSINLSATDAAGNVTTSEYLLTATSDTLIEWLAPAANSEILLQNPGQTLNISARLSKVVGIGDVQIEVEGQNTSPVTLTLDTDIASGQIILPDTAGEYNLNLKVLDTNNQVLSSSSRTINLQLAQALELEIIKMTPLDEASDAEPNDFISVFFNKPVDLNLLSIQLNETVHGFNYINTDPPGLDSMNAKGYVLQEVDLDYDPVPGVFSLLPGNTTAIFYPQRELAYNADLYATINYDGQEILRRHFKIRPRPTFIEGILLDNLGQPVTGVEVSLTDLQRVTTTDSEGGYSFGFGDNAENNIPGGLHEVTVNAGLKDIRFGSIRTRINIQQGARNVIPAYTLPLLNQEIPFSYINSHATQIFNGGELSLNTEQVDLQFPNDSNEGPVHVQFLPGNSIQIPAFNEAYIPHWVYSIQPSGIKVEGDLSIDLELPTYRQSYDYAPKEGELVLLLGNNENSSHLIPVGVGEAITGNHVHSVGITHFKLLDTIALSQVMPEQRLDLRAYQQGEIDLQELTYRLQTFKYSPPKDEAEALSRANALKEQGIK